MNDDYRYDIDMSTAGLKIDDTNVFDKVEIPSIQSFNKFISCKHEFKNQQATITTGNFYIEYRMNVKGEDQDSGILTTQADLQTYTVDECIYSYPTEFIRYLYDNRKTLNLPEQQKLHYKSYSDSRYVAFGILVPVSMMNELYSNYKKIKALRRLNIFKK